MSGECYHKLLTVSDVTSMYSNRFICLASAITNYSQLVMWPVCIVTDLFVWRVLSQTTQLVMWPVCIVTDLFVWRVLSQTTHSDVTSMYSNRFVCLASAITNYSQLVMWPVCIVTDLFVWRVLSQTTHS